MRLVLASHLVFCKSLSIRNRVWVVCGSDKVGSGVLGCSIMMFDALEGPAMRQIAAGRGAC